MGSLYYRHLLSKSKRLDLINRAICAAVEPGDVVVEIGSGVGTFAIMAARAGASIVYAIEPDRVAEVAESVIAVNGVKDRIVLLRKRADEVELPEKADLLITEDFSPWFYDDHLVDMVLSNKRRILKEGGKVVPASITLRAAPWGGPVPKMEKGSGYQEKTDYQWQFRPGSPDFNFQDVEGIDFSPLEEHALNTPDRDGIPPGGLLTIPEDLFTLDLADLEQGSFKSRAEWHVERSGSVWGLAIWMEMTLWKDVCYSNAPDEDEAVWGQGHFPLSRPLEVEPGTLLQGEVEARTDPSGRVWWRWKIQEKGKPSTTREGNTFRALPMGESRLKSIVEKKGLPVSRWAAVDAFLLQRLMEKDLQEAAVDTLKEFPELLVDEARARRRASSIRERYVEGYEPE